MAEIINTALLEAKGALSRVGHFIKMQNDMQLVGTAYTEHTLRSQISAWRPAVIVVHDLALVKSIPALCAYAVQAHTEARLILARQNEDAATVAACLRKGFIAYTLAAGCTDLGDVVRFAKYRLSWLDATVAQIIDNAFHEAARKRHMPRILSPSAQTILDGIIGGKSCQMLAKYSATWTEQVVRAQVYNIVRFYQQL